jgi:hypothetical protein
MLDGKNGKPRAIVNIEKAAKQTVREDRRHRLTLREVATYAGKRPRALRG